MRIALASDHAGFQYKTLIARHLAASGHDVVDFGTTSTGAVDYPDFVRLAAAAVANGDCERGIVIVPFRRRIVTSWSVSATISPAIRPPVASTTSSPAAAAASRSAQRRRTPPYR